MNPCKWKGQNMLGFALMEVRDEIQRVYKNYDMIDWQKVNQVFVNE
jgi:SUMO ligase MMS21 Smc5/6 complex component